MLTVEEHPLLYLACVETELDRPLGECPSPGSLVALLDVAAEAPVERSEELRVATRALLRHGGYKPTGRGKPASEYLVRAAGEGQLSPINLVVDALNAVSLHSGIPISAVDLDLVEPPLRVAVAEEGAEYVFNATGQTIRLSGLLCLFDAVGPCANAVKDSQRTKTHDRTRRTFTVFWGHREHARQVDRAVEWFRELLESASARCI